MAHGRGGSRRDAEHAEGHAGTTAAPPAAAEIGFLWLHQAGSRRTALSEVPQVVAVKEQKKIRAEPGAVGRSQWLPDPSACSAPPREQGRSSREATSSRGAGVPPAKRIRSGSGRPAGHPGAGGRHQPCHRFQGTEADGGRPAHHEGGRGATAPAGRSARAPGRRLQPTGADAPRPRARPGHSGTFL